MGGPSRGSPEVLPGNEVGVLWPAAAQTPRMSRMKKGDSSDGPHGVCPSCHQGDLISISLAVSGRDLSFTTCHLCEAKWWYRGGEAIPLQSVIGMVVDARA